MVFEILFMDVINIAIHYIKVYNHENLSGDVKNVDLFELQPPLYSTIMLTSGIPHTLRSVTTLQLLLSPNSAPLPITAPSMRLTTPAPALLTRCARCWVR